MLAIRTVSSARCGSSSQSIGLVGQADVHEELVDRSAFQLEEELEDDAGHYQRAAAKGR